jgi:predicted transcriptional regulator YheO
MSELFENYISIADGIHALLAGHGEVILHDLKTWRIAYIKGNLTKQEIGSPSLIDDLGNLDVNHQGAMTSHVMTLTGKRLKSITILLKTPLMEPFGAMTLHLDISMLEDAKHWLETLISLPRLADQPNKAHDVEKTLQDTIINYMQERGLSLALLTQKHKREIIEYMFHKGIFSVRKSQNIVAKILKIGRATVFKYLKTLNAGQTLSKER